MTLKGGIAIGMEMQIPYHDVKLFKLFVQWLSEYQPAELVIIGDYLDAPAPSRWNRGTAEEYAGNLQGEANTAKRYLADLRNVYAGPISYLMGNHEERIAVYARTKAPAFVSLDALRVPNLLSFSTFDVTEVQPFYSPTPGLVVTHGHLTNAGVSKYAGGTAMALARNQGMSLVCGHTHRHGIIYERFGRKTIFGMETGHMMDVKKAGYIKTGNPNWSAGWGCVEVDSHGGLWPSMVTYRGGRLQGEFTGWMQDD